MNFLQSILDAEVFPAMGCTEPIACAYAAALAAERLDAQVDRIELRVDVGTFKNGAAVIVPNSGGARGNRIAAAIGAVLACGKARMELLAAATPTVLEKANTLLNNPKNVYECLDKALDFRIEATCGAGNDRALCVLSDGHINVERIEKNGESLYERAEATEGSKAPQDYRAALKVASVEAILRDAVDLDESQRAYIRKGIEMNLTLQEAGFDLPGVGAQMRRMHEKGLLSGDLFFRVKSSVAAAVDARMAGAPLPAMTSGGSGNQGIVAILAAHYLGIHQGIDEGRIEESIAVAHALNSYTKCHVGELSVLCGCSLSAGVAVAAALVYQQAGIDMQKIVFAINNVIGDLSGLVCDGAKSGCAMKALSSVEASLRSGFMAIDGFGLCDREGVLGVTAEETIRNLGRLADEGMANMDHTIVDILRGKNATPCPCDLPQT